MTARGYRTTPAASPAARPVQRGDPAYAPAMLVAGLFPPELTAIRAVGLALAALIGGYAIWRRRELRNADVLILLTIALGLAIVAGHRDPRRAAVRVLLRARERHPDRRRRDLRDPDPVPARPARAQPGLADHQGALRRARGPRRGAVSTRRARRRLSRPDRGARARLQRGRQRRPGPRPDPARGLRRADRGPGRRRRVSRRHRGRRPRPRRDRRPARDQPRWRRGAADRLPAPRGLRGAHRRHARRRRPAPAGGDGAAGEAGARRRGGGRPRLAGARPGGAEPPRPRGRDRVLQPGRLIHHPHPRHRLLERLPGRARRRAAPARPAPGAVPHLRVHDRGDQARRARRGRCRSPSSAGSPGTRRSRRWSATGWVSRTRSCAPGCAETTGRGALRRGRRRSP